MDTKQCTKIMKKSIKTNRFFFQICIANELILWYTIVTVTNERKIKDD